MNNNRNSFVSTKHMNRHETPPSYQVQQDYQVMSCRLRTPVKRSVEESDNQTVHGPKRSAFYRFSVVFFFGALVMLLHFLEKVLPLRCVLLLASPDCPCFWLPCEVLEFWQNAVQHHNRYMSQRYRRSSTQIGLRSARSNASCDLDLRPHLISYATASGKFDS